MNKKNQGGDAPGLGTQGQKRKTHYNQSRRQSETGCGPEQRRPNRTAPEPGRQKKKKPCTEQGLTPVARLRRVAREPCGRQKIRPQRRGGGSGPG